MGCGHGHDEVGRATEQVAEPLGHEDGDLVAALLDDGRGDEVAGALGIGAGLRSTVVSAMSSVAMVDRAGPQLDVSWGGVEVSKRCMVCSFVGLGGRGGFVTTGVRAST